MIKLKRVVINKYKSIQKAQTINIDPAITTIVGMNESGKTSFLTALAKTNYFIADKDFEFDIIEDYPRRELIDFQSSDEDCEIVKCDYEISSELLKLIEAEIGKGVFTVKEFSHSHYYKKKATTFSGISANQKKFLELKVQDYTLTNDTKETIIKCNSLNEVAAITAVEGDLDLPAFKADIKKIIDGGFDPAWVNLLESYITRKWIKAKMPKFWYFDDYYPLRGKININKLISQPPASEKDKTSKALFELARIKPEEILNSTENEYEKYIALLEASSNKITDEIFKYWSTNQNLDIEFKIQNTTNPQGQPEKNS